MSFLSLHYNSQEALAKLQHSNAPRSGFRRSKRPLFGTTQVLLAIQQPGRGAAYAVHRPNTGLAAIEMDADELNSKYERMEAEAVEAPWTSIFELSQSRCMHGDGCSHGASCQVGRRLQRVTILTGSIVRVWGALESVLDRNALALPRVERAMRVVRVALDDGRSLVGASLPEFGRFFIHMRGCFFSCRNLVFICARCAVSCGAVA